MADSSSKRKKKADGEDGPASKRRATTKQLYYLANYMAEHKDFSSGRILSTQGKTANEKQWGDLTRVLNDLPGPEKDPYEWKKCWTDLKCNVRGRAAKAKTTMTGRTISQFQDLPDIDMKVLSVIGLDSCVGLQHQEFGLGDGSQDEPNESPQLGYGGSENSNVSSPSAESRVQLLPCEIKTSDSPPPSPGMSDNSYPHHIPITISKSSPNSYEGSPEPSSDAFDSHLPVPVQTVMEEPEEKHKLPPLSAVPPLTKLPISSPIPPLPTLTPLSAMTSQSGLPPLSVIPPLTAITPRATVPIRPAGPSSQPPLPKTFTKKNHSLSSSLSDATDKLQRAQERNTEGLKAIQQAIDRLAAASEASNQIQLQFLAEQRKFSSLLEMAVTHWINKEK